MIKIKNKGLVADLSLLIVAFVWGTGAAVNKIALNYFSPMCILAIRFLIAGILLMIIFPKEVKKINVKDIKAGIIIGIFLFLGFATQTLGLQYTTASKQSFLTAVYVVIVPFIVWIVKKKRPDVYSFAAAFITLIGIWFLTSGDKISLGIGEGLTLICAVFFAMHIVSVEMFADKHSPIGLSIIQICTAAVFSIISVFVFESVPNQITFEGTASILYLALFSTLGAYLIQNIAQRYTSPTHTAIILSLESVFGSAMAVILLSEVFTLRMTIGCIIIFFGIITAETKWSFIKKSKFKLHQQISSFNTK